MATLTAPRIDWASETDLLGPLLVAEIEAYLKTQAPQSTPAPVFVPLPDHGRHLHQWNHGLEHPTPTLLQRLRGIQPRTPVTTAQYLQLISRYIHQHGWLQGALWDTAGRVCILGARAQVLTAGYGTPAVDEHARHLIGNHIRQPIDTWNDTPERQVCDIHHMLQRAAARAH